LKKGSVFSSSYFVSLLGPKVDKFFPRLDFIPRGCPQNDWLDLLYFPPIFHGIAVPEKAIFAPIKQVF
jgi:hypothetical protein